MKIKIEKNSIINYSLALTQITSKNAADTIIKNIKISTLKDTDGTQKLNLTVTNYETLLNIKIDTDFETENEICVSSDKFINIIKEFPDTPIEIETDEKRQWVNIKTGVLETKLPGMDTKLYPNIGWETPEKCLKIKCKDLVTSLKKVISCVSDSINLNYLRGVGVKLTNGNILEFCGSDSMRISRYLLKLDEESQDDLSIIIPKKCCQEIIHILEKETGECEFFYNSNLIQLKSKNITYQTRLIKDKYPDVRKFFDRESSSRLKVNYGELLRFLRVMKAMSDDISHSVKIVFKPNEIELIGEKKQCEANDTIACEFEGDLDYIGFNVNILYNGLSCFSESNDEEIFMDFNSNRDPCVIKSESMKNFQHICMPMKIVW